MLGVLRGAGSGCSGWVLGVPWGARVLSAGLMLAGYVGPAVGAERQRKAGELRDHLCRECRGAVRNGRTEVPFDAPIREGISPYATPTTEQRRSLESATAPFDNVTAILITHWHEDHFSAEAVAAHLRSSPSTRLVSSAEVVQRVKAVAGPAVPAAQFNAVTPEPGASERATGSGVPCTCSASGTIRRGGCRSSTSAFSSKVAARCFTRGDADPAADNFSLLRSLPPVDTALLPFWYVMDDSNRRFVASSIGPRRILGIHLPPSEAADMTKRLSAMKELTLLTSAGMRVPLR